MAIEINEKGIDEVQEVFGSILMKDNTQKILVDNTLSFQPKLVGFDRMRAQKSALDLFENSEAYEARASILRIPVGKSVTNIVSINHILKGPNWSTGNFSSLSSFFEGKIVGHYYSQNLIPNDSVALDKVPLIVTIQGKMLFDNVVLAPDLKGIGSRVLKTYRITDLASAEREKVMMDATFRQIGIENPIMYVLNQSHIKTHFEEKLYPQIVGS